MISAIHPYDFFSKNNHQSTLKHQYYHPNSPTNWLPITAHTPPKYPKILYAHSEGSDMSTQDVMLTNV
ncbi:hypothetical protein BD777DRAFT_127551, partial [Yarrowia lipolytica]